MKTRTKSTAHGHVIIVTLVICLLLGIVLLGVMKLTTNEGQLTGRSQSWNGAIPVAEAGIEEAFTHLKYCPTNRASNGWILNATRDLYTKSRPMGSSFYEVTISTNYDPVITSRGGIRAPHQTNYIVRTVRVQATNEPMFSAAIEASDAIKFAGAGVTINSYDSRDPQYSNPDGSYNPNKFKDTGRVICHFGGFELGNAKIYGRVETTEESALSMGPGAVVGSLLFHLNGGKGIQEGWHTSTSTSEAPPAEPPSGSGVKPARVNGNYTLGSTNYVTDSVVGSVVVNGHATLYVTTVFRVSNLRVEPGASVKLYVNATDVSLSRVDNLNIRAESFLYYGLDGNKFISLGGNGSFCGVIYAPAAELSITGGGNDLLDFLGAIIAKIVDVKGKMNFHFDEATTRLGSRGFTASRWDEL
jgi:hypothetical protein